MFHVLVLTYVRPLDVVDQARPAHVEWVKAQVDAGRLILAGRQESGVGGVLVTSDMSAEAVDEMIAGDPYELAGLVRYDRVTFNATLRAAGL